VVFWPCGPQYNMKLSALQIEPLSYVPQCHSQLASSRNHANGLLEHLRRASISASLPPGPCLATPSRLRIPTLSFNPCLEPISSPRAASRSRSRRRAVHRHLSNQRDSAHHRLECCKTLRDLVSPVIILEDETFCGVRGLIPGRKHPWHWSTRACCCQMPCLDVYQQMAPGFGKDLGSVLQPTCILLRR